MREAQIVFSALPADLAKDLEPQFAKPVWPYAPMLRPYRREADVPLLLPEINADHIALVKPQRARRAAGAAAS